MFGAVSVVLVVEPTLGDKPPERCIDHQLLEDVPFPLGSEAGASEVRGGDVDVVDSQHINDAAHPLRPVVVGCCVVVAAAEANDGVASVGSEAVIVLAHPRAIDSVHEILVREDVEASVGSDDVDGYTCCWVCSGC